MVEKIVPGFDDADMAELFDELYKASSPPPGGFTSRHFADHKNIGIERARTILSEQAAQGKIERKGKYPGPTGGLIYYYYQVKG